jgi:hypothetical protein
MIRRAAIVAGIAAALAGCGPKNMARVSGRVVFKGQPVSGALVMFVPPSGPGAGAVTDDDGRYTLLTGGRYGNWVFTGRCQVSVGESDPYQPRLKLPIPGRLASPVDSGLTADLVPGPNVCDFDLPTDGPPAPRWPTGREP